MMSLNKDGGNVAIIEQSYKIDSVQDAIDLMASALKKLWGPWQSQIPKNAVAGYRRKLYN